jgi:hypothetical protein
VELHPKIMSMFVLCKCMLTVVCVTQWVICLFLFLFLSCGVVLYVVMWCDVMWCGVFFYVVFLAVVLCCVMLCCVVLCCVFFCYVLLYCAVLCCACPMHLVTVK